MTLERRYYDHGRRRADSRQTMAGFRVLSLPFCDQVSISLLVPSFLYGPERERERESGRGPNGGGEMTAARRWERSGSRPHGREGSDWLPSAAGCFITIFQCFQLSLFCWLTLGGFKLDLASDQNVYQTQEILDSLLCLPWS